MNPECPYGRYFEYTFSYQCIFLDGLLSQDQQELCERVAHLEKRVREQEDEIVCLKGALADVLRRVGQVESTRSKKFYNYRE